MKKNIFLILTVLLNFFGYSQTEYLDGVIVLNEGGAGTETSSLSFISAQNDLTNNVFGIANPGVSLGNTAQSLTMQNDIAVVVLNLSNQVKIINNKTFELIATVSGFDNPRYAAIFNGKAYITCWGTPLNDYIAVIDLQTNTIVDTITVADGTEKIKEVNGKLYIAHESGNIITVYDITTNVSQEITVSSTPSELLVIGNDLYVLCGIRSWMPALSPAKIYKINLTTNTVTNSFDLPIGLKAFHMDTDGEYLYIADSADVYKFNLATDSFNSTPFIQTNIEGSYGMYGLNVINDKIYIADAGNYVQPGNAFVYSNQGNLLNTFIVGVIPNHFYKSAQSVLSVDKSNKIVFSMYPNPTSDYLNIHTEEQILDVTIFNVQGRQVLKSNENRLDVSNFTSGIYLIEVKTNSGKAVNKFIKK
ncbi:T9SS type A sorting domain-containing protein [Flavobacterium sp. I3-2]|uniref:T9SS type A sorting domain-containing protein n=1 Tax=Flavobacterium sp. I3-2 TaxID=2748319 RepID=UPI0015AC8A54|nr:DUF5074 domain-containing protein [Flavobacterium sp. I3-2]